MKILNHKPSAFFMAFLLAILCVQFAFAQTDQVRKINVSDFIAIKVSSGIDIHITKSDKETLEIKGTKELVDKVIVTKDANNTLVLYMENNFTWKRLFQKKSINVYISYKKLNAITASGGSDVYTTNTLTTNNLNLQASGGSDLRLVLDCNNLEVVSSGGSDVYLKGKANNISFRSSGGSDIHAYELISENGRVTTSGGSDARVYVTAALEGSTSGGSDLYYKGNAVLKNSSPFKRSSIHKVK